MDSCVLVYSMEFALNLYLVKLPFLKDWMTWLDLFVIVCGWLEIVIHFLSQPTDVYFFRDFRVLRVVRIMRLANFVRKARSLRELRKMLTMLSTCTKTLAWSMLFCFGMMTMWAMLLVELVNPLCCTDTEACIPCMKATGSIMEANLLLFKTVIAGDSWGNIAVPLIEAAPLTAILFCGSLLTLAPGQSRRWHIQVFNSKVKKEFIIKVSYMMGEDYLWAIEDWLDPEAGGLSIKNLR
ncbi:CACNA1B [Symbiodinium natans]|uniref:CACNA1B protein n=1 Tax=Symbiodinium natans TaxID=878477 RepID=A0A812MXC7_9DINO|nr:CACNA1B [Symbiodinium natans]